MKIGIIDYKAGNVRSVALAIERLGHSALLSADPNTLNSCDKIIFPGVGHAKHAMEKLESSGLVPFIRETKKPLLGICLGMQLLCKESEEGNVTCVGIFDTPVKRFVNTEYKVPHTGWNKVTELKGDLFKGIPEETYYYFVHSYYAGLCNQTSGKCQYSLSFTASLEQDNFFAVQFHPEKSGSAGEQLLKNFLSI